MDAHLGNAFTSSRHQVVTFTYDPTIYPLRTPKGWTIWEFLQVLGASMLGALVGVSAWRGFVWILMWILIG